MPSTPQVLPTVKVWDYVTDPTTGQPVPQGTPVTVTWKILQGSVTNPIVQAVPKSQTLYTDANGFWTMTVVPTDRLSPANSTYHVSDGYNSYDVNPVLAGYPGGDGWQALNIRVAPAPAVLNPAGQTTGNLQVNGTLGVTGAVTLSALTPGQVVFPGAAGLLSGSANLFWDNANSRLTLGVSAPQSTALMSIRLAGNDIEFGHSNAAGYGSNLGANAGDGRPALAFNSEFGTTVNTFRTRGFFGSIIQSDLLGGLVFGTVGNVNADNQALVSLMTLSHAGGLVISNGLTVTAGAVVIGGTIAVTGNAVFSSTVFARAATSIWNDVGVLQLHGSNSIVLLDPVGVGAAPFGGAGFDLTLNVSTLGGVGYGFFLRPTLTALVNGDFLGTTAYTPTFATGTFTGLTAAGLYITGIAKTGTGTINNAYGVLVNGPIAIGTNNFAAQFNNGSVVINGDSGAGVGGALSLTNAVGIGNGANTNMQAPLKGTGGGPTTATLVTDWIKIYDGATTKWIPAFT